MVVCLKRGADLHTAQLMPLPLTVSCFSKIQIGFTFLVPAHPGSSGQRAVKRERVRARVYLIEITGRKCINLQQWMCDSWTDKRTDRLKHCFVAIKNKAVIDRRLHPRCCHLEGPDCKKWFRATAACNGYSQALSPTEAVYESHCPRLATTSSYLGLCANITTSKKPTKNTQHITAPRLQKTNTENLARIGRLDMIVERQTHRHTQTDRQTRSSQYNKKVRSRQEAGQRMLPTERKYTCTHVRPHAQTDGQQENILPLGPSIGWARAKELYWH